MGSIAQHTHTKALSKHQQDTRKLEKIIRDLRKYQFMLESENLDLRTQVRDLKQQLNSFGLHPYAQRNLASIYKRKLDDLEAQYLEDSPKVKAYECYMLRLQSAATVLGLLADAKDALDMN